MLGGPAYSRKAGRIDYVSSLFTHVTGLSGVSLGAKGYDAMVGVCKVCVFRCVCVWVRLRCVPRKEGTIGSLRYCFTRVDDSYRVKGYLLPGSCDP